MITAKEIGACVGVSIDNRAPIQGLTLDSRSADAVTGFVAVPGLSTDGRRFFSSALEKAAPVIVYEAKGIETFYSPALLEVLKISHPRTNFLPVADLSKHLGALAKTIYPYSPGALTVAAVTGTNGKTTTSGWIAEACHRRQAPAGWSGTLGIGSVGALVEAGNTTPDLFTLHRWLFDLHHDRGRYAALEASSHALSQGRLNGIPIHTAVWTQLSHDHLDYHGTMSAYAMEKKKLLQWSDLRYCVLNLGDQVARSVYLNGEYAGQALTYLLGSPDEAPPVSIEHVDFYVSAWRCLPEGLEVMLRSAEGEWMWHLPCWGVHNVQNALAALATLVSFGWTVRAATEALADTPLPPGRLERFTAPGFPDVIVDYAHTPDALQHVIQAVRAHCHGKVWVVFGCGGDRDNTKRPVMGAVAERLADHVILTDDNPRTEASEQILCDIQAGMVDRSALFLVQAQRRAAISAAVQAAGSTDVVIVAGKGHENYQEIGQERLPYSDRDTVQRLLGLVDAR
ncbi:MAG: UDP-N-acetylmuramoyl-L-alanyl-D-glutamate--2,6-diaminopimelate ligase [Gammaproteobacteria bacterium]